jgi:hypothetical protein
MVKEEIKREFNNFLKRTGKYNTPKPIIYNKNSSKKEVHSNNSFHPKNKKIIII